MPDVTPQFGRLTCEHCGKTFWELFSRIDPQAFTEEAFADRYIVDEATKRITSRTLHPTGPYGARMI
jgi:hypothetical protein